MNKQRQNHKNNSEKKPRHQSAHRKGVIRKGAKPKGAQKSNRSGDRSQSFSSEARAKVCPISRECGACSHVNMPYEKQLRRKQQYIEELFEKVAGDECILEPIAGMDCPLGFRNKIVSPIAPGRRLPGGAKKVTDRGSISGQRGKASAARREVLHGMYALGTHRIVKLDACPVEHESGRRIVRAVVQLMGKYGIPAYEEDTGMGFMRHVMVRVGHQSNEVLVTLVTNESEFKGSKNFARELAKRCPEITTIVQNINTRQTNVILGDEERVIYGPGFILDTLCGLSFRISSHSFYQVNAVQTEVLYRTAIDWALDGVAQADAENPLRIMDAYCGTGTIGLVAASMSGNAQVVGVDKVEQAIRDARQNALHNGIDNATFVADDAGPYLRRCASEGQRFDVLLMDPPRAGSSEEFLRAAAESKVDRIVYISCNPETQVRDVRILKELGYELERIRPVDMFPHTDHVEMVALLSRAEAN